MAVGESGIRLGGNRDRYGIYGRRLFFLDRG